MASFIEYSSDKVSAPRRARQWFDTVNSIYYPIDTVVEAQFSGSIKGWKFGESMISWQTSDAVCYRRERKHCDRHLDAEFLITFALRGDSVYVSDHSRVTCHKNHFIIEAIHIPYEFSHTSPNEHWSVKVPTSILHRHVRRIEDYASYEFNAAHGMGALFFEMVRRVPAHIAHIHDAFHDDVAENLAELLSLTLEGDERVLGSRQNSVQMAHLARIDRFIRGRLPDPALSPDVIAQACGISTRYLHELFRGSGSTVGQWILKLRLEACERDLSDPINRCGIAEIAYRWGFTSQAQFSRRFKEQFGVTPRAVQGEGCADRTGRAGSRGVFGPRSAPAVDGP